MAKVFVTSILAAAMSAALTAQSQKQMEFMQKSQDQSVRLQAAMADAQAKANHPGDNKMSCDDLESEIIATMHDPTFEASVAQTNETATHQLEEAKKRQREEEAKAAASVVHNLMMGIAATFVPGFSVINAKRTEEMAKQQRAADDARAEKNFDESLKMMDGMIAMMPQLMRTSRVLELGHGRKCAWAPENMPTMAPMPTPNKGKRR